MLFAGLELGLGLAALAALLFLLLVSDLLVVDSGNRVKNLLDLLGVDLLGQVAHQLLEEHGDPVGGLAS